MPFARGTDAGNRIKGAGFYWRFDAGAVRADGKAVRLIAQTLQIM